MNIMYVVAKCIIHKYLSYSKNLSNSWAKIPVCDHLYRTWLQNTLKRKNILITHTLAIMKVMESGYSFSSVKTLCGMFNSSTVFWMSKWEVNLILQMLDYLLDLMQVSKYCKISRSPICYYTIICKNFYYHLESLGLMNTASQLRGWDTNWMCVWKGALHQWVWDDHINFNTIHYYSSSHCRIYFIQMKNTLFLDIKKVE